MTFCLTASIYGCIDSVTSSTNTISTGRPCPTAAEIENLGRLAVLEDLDVIGAQIADRLAVLIGQAEIECDAAVGVEMLQARIADHNLHRGERARSGVQLQNEQRGKGQRRAGQGG